MKVIIVSGTPGSGKTSLATALAKKLKYKYIDVNSLIKKEKLYEGYDKKSKSYIVDIDRLKKFLVGLIKRSRTNLIIDSHLSHYLNPKYVNLCIITKCELKILERRLKKRGYSPEKIRENMDTEIFDVCYTEAVENKHKVKVFNTSKGVRKGLKSFNRKAYKG